MDMRLVSAKTVGQILLSIGFQEIIRDRSVPGEYKDSMSENRSSSHGRKAQNGNFLKNGCKYLYYILVIYGNHLSERKCIGNILRKIRVLALGAQTRNSDFVGTGFMVRWILFLLGIQQSTDITSISKVTWSRSMAYERKWV
jgi:hypothetical protein